MNRVILALVCATAMTGFVSDARASGGTETIKVSKCFRRCQTFGVNY